MALTITDDQKVSVSISFVDDHGNPATVEAGIVPAWTVSDETLATVTAAADGMSADIATVGPLGTAQVTVTSPVTAGGPALTGTLDLSIVAGAAAVINVVAGAPVAK